MFETHNLLIGVISRQASKVEKSRMRKDNCGLVGINLYQIYNGGQRIELSGIPKVINFHHSGPPFRIMPDCIQLYRIVL